MRGMEESSGSLSATLVWMRACLGVTPCACTIRDLTNAVLEEMSGEFKALYSRTGRPGIAPEKLLRALLLQAHCSIRSERQPMEQLEFSLLFRWLVGLGIDNRVRSATVFTTGYGTYRVRMAACRLAPDPVCGAFRNPPGRCRADHRCRQAVRAGLSGVDSSCERLDLAAISCYSAVPSN